jgi:RIO kinase 2
MKLNPELI